MKRGLIAVLFALQCSFAQTPQNPMVSEGIAAFKKGDYENARMLFDAALAQNPKDTTAQNYARIVALKIKSGNSGLQASLKTVIIPKIQFTDATPRECVDYVVQRIDKLTEGKQKVSVVWMVPESFNALVTLSLQNVPATEALRYIAEMAGLQIDYDTYAITIRPAAPGKSAGT